jgi:tetratricopeptide (TPR) repeat protein
VLHVRRYPECLHEPNELICIRCIDPSPEPSGRFAEALRLFDRFLQESDLDAARQCVDIYKYLLVNFNDDVKAHSRDSATFPSEVSDSRHPIGSQKRYHVLIQLARTLEERHRYAGDAHDLESAAAYGEEALALCHAENMICPTVWVFYAVILTSTFYATTSCEKLRRAETLCREAMPLCRAAHSLNSMNCHALSWISRRQFDQTGDEALLDEAIYLQRTGLKRLPKTGSHNKHRHLLRLAQVLALKYYHGGTHTDDVLSILLEAIQFCPPMHVDKWMLHSRMFQQLLHEYQRTSKLEFLHEAIELGRQALSTGNFPSRTRRAAFLDQMGYSLRVRYERARTNDKDIEEAVALHRQALQISALHDVNRWNHAQSLAISLVLQFCSDGNMGHLEEASQLHRHAIDLIPKSNPCRPNLISGVARCLGLRFRETGDVSELNQAIELDREAMANLRSSSQSYANSTVQMVSHLCLRFEVLHENDDLKEAIATTEELLRSLPDTDWNRIEAINILAKARLLYAQNQKDLGDIDSSIEQLLSMKGDLSRSTVGAESLRTLAACHLAKFCQLSAVDHAHRARNTINEVLGRIVPDHYERFQCLIDAAELYMQYGTPYHDIDIALKHLSDALGNSNRDVRSKIRGAKHVLDKLETEHHHLFTTMSSTSLKLLDIIGGAVLLLPRVAFFGTHPYSRLRSLKEGQSIAMTGASHALNLSLPEKALEIMEQGRAIFWTHTLRLRSPFDEIPETLRNQLVSLARRLEKVTNASENFMDQQVVEREAAQRRKDSKEFNSLVEQVRCLPGLESFMLSDGYSTLKQVAEKGPVVVLACSTLACHAIVLKPSKKAISIPLEAITDKWLIESASVWRSTVTEARLAMRDGRKLVGLKKVSDPSYTRSKRILCLLWTNIVLPVIQALEIKVKLNIYRLKY